MRKWDTSELSSQIVPKTFTQHLELVTITCNGLLTMDQRRLSADTSPVTATSSVMNISQQRQIYRYVVSYSRRAACLTKHTVIVQIIETPIVMEAVYVERQRGFGLRNPRKLTNFIPFLEQKLQAEFQSPTMFWQYITSPRKILESYIK